MSPCNELESGSRAHAPARCLSDERILPAHPKAFYFKRQHCDLLVLLLTSFAMFPGAQTPAATCARRSPAPSHPNPGERPRQPRGDGSSWRTSTTGWMSPPEHTAHPLPLFQPLIAPTTPGVQGDPGVSPPRPPGSGQTKTEPAEMMLHRDRGQETFLFWTTVWVLCWKPNWKHHFDRHLQPCQKRRVLVPYPPAVVQPQHGAPLDGADSLSEIWEKPLPKGWHVGSRTSRFGKLSW